MSTQRLDCLTVHSPPNRRAVSDKRATSALVTIWILLATAVWASDRKGDFVGFVLDVSGTCISNNSENPIQVGERLREGTTLSFQGPRKATDHFDIAMADGTMYSLRCDPIWACNSPIRLPNVAKGNSVMRTILESVLPHSGDYVVPISRDLQPPETVVSLDDGKLDLTPLLRHAPGGSYTVVFSPVPSTLRATTETTTTASITRTKELPLEFSIPDLRAGLYIVSIPELGVNDAWTLIAPYGDYNRDTQALQEASEQDQRWQIGGTGRYVFLRTFLACLAAKQR